MDEKKEKATEERKVNNRTEANGGLLAKIPKKAQIAILAVVLIVALVGCVSHIRKVHMYRNSPVIGTWTYDYSIAYDGDENWTRDDFEQENSDMAIDVELTFKDDGTFTMTMEDQKIAGTWKPDKDDDSVYILSSEDAGFDGLMEEDIIWMEEEYHALVFSIIKDYSRDDLRKLFRQGEDYIDVVLKSDGTTHGDHGLIGDGSDEGEFEDEED